MVSSWLSIKCDLIQHPAVMMLFLQLPLDGPTGLTEGELLGILLTPTINKHYQVHIRAVGPRRGRGRHEKERPGGRTLQ